MSRGTTLTAEWLDDGFFHPPHQVGEEFVDVDEYVRIPVLGVQESVQFARVAVSRREETAPEEVLVLGQGGVEVAGPVLSYSASRFPSARLVVLESTANGHVVTSSLGRPITLEEAAAIAVSQYRLAWDESKRITIVDGERKLEVAVEYAPDAYILRVFPASDVSET